MRALAIVLCVLGSAVPAWAEPLEAMHERAQERVAVNDFRGAIRIYSDIVLAEPDDAVAYTDMGRCYMILGDFDRAEDSFKNALHIDPDDPTALEGLVRIHDPDMDRYFEERTPELPDLGPGFVEKQIEGPSITAPPAAASATDPFAARPKVSSRTAKRQQAQRALTAAGFYNGPIDGTFGPETKQAVASFQMQNGLIPDGVIGPKTWALLKPYAENLS